MAYNLLRPVSIFSTTLGNTNMTTSQTSAVVEVKNQDNIGVQLHWTGTPTGSFAFQISSDYMVDAEGNVTNPGNWITLPVSPAITAAGSADDAYVDLNQQSTQYCRVVYTAISGSGTLTGLMVAKGV